MNLTQLLIQIVVAGLVAYLVWWLISYIGLPSPFDKVARAVVAVVVVLFLINLLLTISGSGPVFKLR